MHLLNGELTQLLTPVWMGKNFDDYPGFQPKTTHAPKIAIRCILETFQNFLIRFNTFYIQTEIGAHLHQ